MNWEGARAPSPKNEKTMRQSLADFIDKCFEVKCHLEVGSYEIHDYEDGSYADFHPRSIKNVAKLAIVSQGFDAKILLTESGLTFRMFENYSE